MTTARPASRMRASRGLRDDPTCAAAGRPHVGQNFHPNSSSDPHAGQFKVVTFWPQCGQNVIGRPVGSGSLHERHRSPARGTTTRTPPLVFAVVVGVGIAAGVAFGVGARRSFGARLGAAAPPVEPELAARAAGGAAGLCLGRSGGAPLAPRAEPARCAVQPVEGASPRERPRFHRVRCPDSAARSGTARPSPARMLERRGSGFASTRAPPQRVAHPVVDDQIVARAGRAAR